MHKIRVGVLRGGPSSEYDVSLKTGGAVLKHLPEKYQAHDIFISKDGAWHFEGVVKTPGEILRKVDVIFNAMHGEFGEDGKVQAILDDFSMPYTGSGSLASALGMNKILAKQVFLSNGIKTPLHVTVNIQDQGLQNQVMNIFKKFPMPVVVKPATTGSSVGVSIAHDFFELNEAIQNASQYSQDILIEEFIRGREATCGILNHFRGEETYALLPVEIIPPPKNGFFDYKAKYEGETKEICPGNFSEEEKKEIQRLASLAHKALDLKHYSRSDFIISPKRGIYILEVNTLPGLTEQSLYPKSLHAIGSNIPEFLDHVITLAIKKK